MRDPHQSLTTLSEAERALAMKHFSILQPVLEEGISQTEVARLHHISLRTIQRWIGQYRQYGLVGLARQERADRGTRRGLEADLIHLIEGLALQKPKRSAAAIHR
jgi:putative transposase